MATLTAREFMAAGLLSRSTARNLGLGYSIHPVSFRTPVARYQVSGQPRRHGYPLFSASLDGGSALAIAPLSVPVWLRNLAPLLRDAVPPPYAVLRSRLQR